MAYQLFRIYFRYPLVFAGIYGRLYFAVKITSARCKQIMPRSKFGIKHRLLRCMIAAEGFHTIQANSEKLRKQGLFPFHIDARVGKHRQPTVFMDHLHDLFRRRAIPFHTAGLSLCTKIPIEIDILF